MKATRLDSLHITEIISEAGLLQRFSALIYGTGFYDDQFVQINIFFNGGIYLLQSNSFQFGGIFINIVRLFAALYYGQNVAGLALGGAQTNFKTADKVRFL